MNRVDFERLQSYPYPLPDCFQKITYSELSIQLPILSYQELRLSNRYNETFAGEDDNYHTTELEMHDKYGKKRGFISQALDNAKLKLSKLLSSNYNALIFI